MPVRRIVPDLHADDPGSAEAFYRDVLGLTKAMDLGWVAAYSDPATPSAQIIVIREDETAPVRPAVSIEIDDVDAAHAAALRAGAEIVHPLTDEPWGVRRFFVRDPATGAVLNILQHR